jgi:putative membrane protein
MLSKQEIKLVEDAVARAELKTSGEIVPLIVNESQSYSFVYFIPALCGFLLASLYLFLTDNTWGEPRTFTNIVLTQMTGMIVLSTLPLFPFIRRLLIRKKTMTASVNQASLSNFIATGLMETRDRTGILIYLSRFERTAVILADKGIHDKVTDNYWQDIVDTIVTGIKQKKTGEALVKAIDAMGDKLSEHFPPREDDTDEISNKVRFGKQHD